MDNFEEILKKKLNSEFMRIKIKGMIEGNQTAYKTILNLIESGESLEQIKDFCEKSTKGKGKKTFEKMVNEVLEDEN